MRKILLILLLLFFASYTVIADTTWHNETFGGSVTVEETNSCPVSSSESPSNQSIRVDIDVGYWNVSITDSNGNTTSGTIVCSNGDDTSWSDTANGTKSLTLSTLDYDTNYTVWLNFTDGECTVNETYWFVTIDEEIIVWHSQTFGGSVTVLSDNPPQLTDPDPSNGSSNVEIDISQVNITISDNYGSFNFTIQGSFLSNVNLNSQSNGTYNASITSLDYDTTYYWYVNCTDGNSWTNETYHFTTRSEIPIDYIWHSSTFGGSVTVTRGNPQISGVSPTNGSSNQAINTTILSINVTDEEGDCFTVQWSTNASGWTQSNVSCSDGTFTQIATFASAEATTYWWTVRVNDTDGNWNNQTFHFTTREYGWSEWSDTWTIGQTSIYDVSLDMQVDVTDITTVTSVWHYTGDPGWIKQDIAQDGVVDALDLSGIANHYGENYVEIPE